MSDATAPRLEYRPFTTHSLGRVRSQLHFTAECPWCGRGVTVWVWSYSGSGRKKCPCGAMFMRHAPTGESQVSEKRFTVDTRSTKG